MKIKCTYCNQENEGTIVYCKDCGHALHESEQAGVTRTRFNSLVGSILALGCLLAGVILLNGMLGTGNRYYGLFGLWNIAVYAWICINIPNKSNRATSGS